MASYGLIALILLYSVLLVNSMEYQVPCYQPQHIVLQMCAPRRVRCETSIMSAYVICCDDLINERHTGVAFDAGTGGPSTNKHKPLIPRRSSINM